MPVRGEDMVRTPSSVASGADERGRSRMKEAS